MGFDNVFFREKVTRTLTERKDLFFIEFDSVPRNSCFLFFQANKRKERAGRTQIEKNVHRLTCSMNSLSRCHKKI